MPAHVRSLVVLDWNGFGLEAVLCDRHGDATERQASNIALGSAAHGAHEGHVARVTAAWRETHGPLRILAPGMIGSRNGWLEMPYVATPAGIAEIASGARRLGLETGDEIFFLPGLTCRSALPHPDVMRGEETQILGADIAETSRVVLPGGHTKWAEIANDRVVRFQTFVTGELIAALQLGASLLKPARRPATRDWAAFEQGLAAAADIAGENRGPGLLSRLFFARTGWLAGAVPDTALHDYVAGLVISCEVEEARRQDWLGAGDRIGIVGTPDEVEPYQRALRAYGVTPVIAAPGAGLRGAARINDCLC